MPQVVRDGTRDAALTAPRAAASMGGRPAEDLLITGLGVVSCLGSTVDAYWDGLMAGESRPQSVSDPLARMANRLLYGIEGFDRRHPEPARAGDRAGRAVAFAVDAAADALHDAGIGAGHLAQGRGACVAVGTGMGHQELFEASRAPGATEPAGLSSFPFGVSSMVAARLGLCGPSLDVSSACSASGYAISLAASELRRGQVPLAVAGGADTYTRAGVGCFNRMGALDPLACRPFDAERAGTVFGEGAAIMVIEPASQAQLRGRTRSYATVEGSGWSCDAHHVTAPEPSADRIVAAMRGAISQANLRPEDIGCIVPHGTGTGLNDVVESRALHIVFGDRAGEVPVFSLKGMLGHTGGAAAAFSILTAALILDRGVIPPNASITTVDPRCALNLAGRPLTAPVSHVLVNAYAFGGSNISLVIGRP
jgi:3-oxoacyl-[acyl-carrier-protein] synthase II